MATAAGLLGQADFFGGAGTVVLFTCPDGQKAHVTVSLCSNNPDPVKVRAGWATGTRTAPRDAEWLLGGTIGKSLLPGETHQVTMTLGPGQKACAGAESFGIAATASGLVEDL